ncbi:hypothetical protein B7R54_12265 [Subtercola boreus]|uniref:Transcriptional regulator n=2 Tax=Subtercola boreus TaxID=120213 RepID=A0A3E0VQW9_9MICO|nr:hypothetical protein B7R54_12265 [Subtercola boreus]
MTETTVRTAGEAWLDQLDPASTPLKDGRHLRTIGNALSALDDAEAAVRLAVTQARAAGDSWEAIGLVLGTSRQAAHRKYGRA